MMDTRCLILTVVLMGFWAPNVAYSLEVIASSHDGNLPSNTIDGSLSTRWSAKGEGQWIRYDLQDNYKIDDIDIAFYKGSERNAYFDIDISADATHWVNVYSGMSRKVSGLQNVNIDDQVARYLKITGYGNTVNRWNSVLEVEINTLGKEVIPGEAVSVTGQSEFRLEKHKTDFSVDGNNGAQEGQQIYLWDSNNENINQQWVEKRLSNGFVQYQKNHTELCFDGGDGASRRQAVTLEVCDVSNVNQHWKKKDLGNNVFRLAKRDTNYSIDGNGGAERRQQIYLWNSSDTNVNQQWKFYALDDGLEEKPDDIVDPENGLDPNLPPGSNFDLNHWKITFPDASEKSVEWLSDGGERENEFYTDPATGGMVFRCPNSGATTSSKTKYPRTELREMLRGTNDSISTKGVNENNWVLSTSNESSRLASGGINGRLSAELSVDHVSISGDDSMVGRVVVGQIHGSEDEPLKIYYRKLPGHEKGSVYFTYEKWQGSDVKYHLIGHSSNSADEPSNGIKLGERWRYDVVVEGRDMLVRITTEDGREYDDQVTIESAYNNDWMYFKAGVYNQNNGGDEGDYVQATFFSLEHTHD